MSHHAMRHNEIDWEAFGYQHIKICGGGTYGRAYLLRYLRDDSLRIAKVVDMSELTLACRQNALQEANLLLRFQHPHIVPCYEAFIHQDCYLVMIMEYCQGGDMACCISNMRATNTTFTESEISKMLQQLLAALMFIHGNQILHRDLKPSNILIDKNGDLKIADFGVSKLLPSGTSCSAHTSVGTANYMPPEMCKRRPYTYHSDMWSLGCVIYEMVTLRSAFVGESLIALAWNVCFENPPAVNGDYSLVLKELVLNLLNKEPDARYLPSRLLHHPFITNATRLTILERSLPGSCLTEGKPPPYGGGGGPPPAFAKEQPLPTVDDLDETPPRRQRAAPPPPQQLPTKQPDPPVSIPTETAVVIESPPSSPTPPPRPRTLSYCGTGANETLYCQLIIKRIRLGIMNKHTHLAVMLLRVGADWDELVRTTPYPKPKVSDRTDSDVLDAIYNEIFDNHPVCSERPYLCSSTQLDLCTAQEHLAMVLAALEKPVEMGGLLKASQRFGLHLSLDEARLLIEKMQNGSPSIMDLETMLSEPFTEFRDSFSSVDCTNGPCSDSAAAERLLTADEVYEWAASLLLNAETAAGLQAAVHNFASGPGEVRVVRSCFERLVQVKFEELNSDERNRLYQVCSKSIEGDVLWPSTLRALTTATQTTIGPSTSATTMQTTSTTMTTQKQYVSSASESSRRADTSSDGGRSCSRRSDGVSPVWSVHAASQAEQLTHARSALCFDSNSRSASDTKAAAAAAAGGDPALGNNHLLLDRASRKSLSAGAKMMKREQHHFLPPANNNSDDDLFPMWPDPPLQQRRHDESISTAAPSILHPGPFSMDDHSSSQQQQQQQQTRAKVTHSDTRSTLASSDESIMLTQADAAQERKWHRPCVRPQARQQSSREWVRVSLAELKALRPCDLRQPVSTAVRLLFELPEGINVFDDDPDISINDAPGGGGGGGCELSSVSDQETSEPMLPRPAASSHQWEQSRANQESADELAKLLLYTIVNLELIVEELIISTRDYYPHSASSRNLGRLAPNDSDWNRLRQALTDADHMISTIVPPKIYQHQQRVGDSPHEWLSEAFERLSNYIAQATTHIHTLAGLLRSTSRMLSKGKVYDYAGTFSRLSRELVKLLGPFVSEKIYPHNILGEMMDREKDIAILREAQESGAYANDWGLRNNNQPGGSTHYHVSEVLEAVLQLTKDTRRWAEHYVGMKQKEESPSDRHMRKNEAPGGMDSMMEMERNSLHCVRRTETRPRADSRARQTRHRAGSTWVLPHTDRLYDSTCRGGNTRNIATMTNLQYMRSVDERYGHCRPPPPNRRSSVMAESSRSRRGGGTSQSSNSSRGSSSRPRKFMTGPLEQQTLSSSSQQQQQQRESKRTQSRRN